MTKHGFIISVVIPAIVVFMAGCSDDPNTVGLGVLPPEDMIQVTSYEAFATSDTTFLSRIPGGSSTLLLGKYQTLEARTLLSFSGFAAISALYPLDSARLTLRINYRYKDSSGTVGIEARKFTRSFSGSTFTWDSAAASGAYSDTVSGSLLQTISPQDTILTLRIDTTLIRQWTQSNSGSLILLPTGSTVAGVSTLNTPTDARPEIRVYFRKDDTLATRDSLSLRMGTGIFVADGGAPQNPGSITLQAGVAYRGILRFDSLAIPKRVSVTQALLEIAADTVSSQLNSYSDDNILAFLLRKNFFPYDSVAIATKCAPAYVGMQKVYRADVKAIVQQWLLREPNNGFFIRASGDVSTFDRFVLYGSSSALRPKLTITYSVLP